MNKLNQETINICLVFNDSDWEYTKKIFPTLFSILENSKQDKIKIFFICKGVKQEYKDYIHEIFNTYSQEFCVIDDFGDKEYLVDFFKENNTSSWNYWIFFKLLIPFLLPKGIQKVINFDSDDVIINKSLRDMWKIELWDKLIGSVKGYRNKNSKIKFNLPYPTFRVGWNIYNLNALRKIDFEYQFKKILNKYWDRLSTPESDILNIFCNDKVLYVDDKYNYVPKDYKTFDSWKIAYHFNDKKFFLFTWIFWVHKNYKLLYKRYYTLSKFPIDKKNNILRSLNSISICNYFIRKLSKIVDALWIKQILVKKLY